MAVRTAAAGSLPTYRGCARYTGAAGAAQRVIQGRVRRRPGRQRALERAESPAGADGVPGQLAGAGAGAVRGPGAQAVGGGRAGRIRALAGAGPSRPHRAEAAARVDVHLLQGGAQRTEVARRADADGVEFVGERGGNRAVASRGADAGCVCRLVRDSRQGGTLRTVAAAGVDTVAVRSTTGASRRWPPRTHLHVLQHCSGIRSSRSVVGEGGKSQSNYRFSYVSAGVCYRKPLQLFPLSFYCVANIKNN